MTRSKTVRIFVALSTVLLALCSLGERRPTLAFAKQGNVTITQQNNSDATYDAYLVFRADIDARDQASDVSWPDDETKAAVLSFLDGHGYPSWLEGKHEGHDQHNLAQNAAEYIIAMISGSESDLGAATTPRSTAGRSFANALASHLAGQGIRPDGTASSGRVFEGEQGLWLFVTTSATIDSENEAGSGPIWLPLGGSVSQILEKSDIPTLDMKVREDSNGDWGKVADSNRNQALSYRLTGTLPENFDSFPTYHYRFDVAFPSGIELDAEGGSGVSKSLKVKVGDREATIDGNELAASYEKGRLTIDFANLKSNHWTDFSINKDTVITVSYAARLNRNATVGVPGNVCEAQLTYTGDPVSAEDARSETVDVAVFTYQMSLIKVDKQTKDKLEGAVFSIQVAQGNSDAESRGLYIQEDGSLGTSIHAFTTGKSGTLAIAGLDEGTYLINEVTAPDGYLALGDVVTLSIESELSEVDRSLKSFRATSSSQASTLVEVQSDKGTLALSIENERQPPKDVARSPIETLAQTGVGPIAGTLVLAGVFVTLIASRRRPRH